MNNACSRVDVFAAGAKGNVAPIRSITGPATQLTSANGGAPVALTVDAQGTLYVASTVVTVQSYQNVDDIQIDEFASNAAGNVSPALILTPNPAYLGNESTTSLAVDGASNLYVSGATGVLVFAKGASGLSSGTRQIYTSGTVNILSMALGPQYTNLYLGQALPPANVTVYPATASGASSPLAQIKGATTQLNDTVGGRDRSLTSPLSWPAGGRARHGDQRCCARRRCRRVRDRTRS